MKDKYTDIELSEKHTTLRLILFCAAFIIAVVAFTNGVASIGHKEPGLYAVDAAPDDAVPLYANNIALAYRFAGSSSEIRGEMNALKSAYSAALKHAYILLDAEKTYDGVVNLAALNAAQGQPVDVGEELFAVLTDAWERTRAQQGYSMFAGALYAEWNGILILDEPEPFDPLQNAEEAARIARLAELTNDLEQFRFEIVDAAAHTVRFEVSAEYRALLQELEITAPVLDLNLLHDAYELRSVADALRAQGWENGYLSSTDGATLALPAYDAGTFCLYGTDGKSVTSAATLPAAAGAAFSQFRAFAYSDGEYGFYRIQDGAHELWRHPYLPASGEYPEVLASSCVVSDAGDIVDACWTNVRLFACASEAEAAALAQGDGGHVIGCILRSDAQPVVRANAAGLARLSADADYGWGLAAIETAG